MTELQSLMAQRDELLDKIRVIEETCEGIENENNAKRVQALNLEQAQITAQKAELQAKLTAMQSRLDAINSEVTSLSGTGVDRILEAIKKQRWYFFKNKTKIMFDKRTGLLWPNLTYYNLARGGIWERCTGPHSYQDDVTFLKELTVDEMAEWKLPSFQIVKETLDSKEFPFFHNNSNCCIKTNSNSYVYSLRISDGICVAIDGGEAKDFFKGSWDCGIFPCSDILIKDSGYQNNVFKGNPIFSEKQRLHFTLSLFVQNGLWPIFDDDEITQLYKKIYFEKPPMLEKLQELQSQIEVLQEVTLLSSEFDYTALLSKYDVSAANKSIIKYYQTIQRWCDELLDKLDYYEQAMEGIIRDFNLISLKLSKKYEDNPNLNKAENELLANRQRYFQNKFSLGMHSVKSKILAVKKQADDLEYRIDEIDNGDDAIRALALLEKEERASFEFIAENTAKIIKNALLKVEYFQDNHQFVMSAITIWEKWSEDYRIFKTTYREDLKAQCEDDGIEEEVWTKWYEDWQKLRFAIEQKVQPIIERGLRSEMPTVEKTEISITELLISALEKYKEGVDLFFKEERKGIYQKFVFQAGGELQEKFESEGELYKCTASFQNTLQEIVFNCANAEDRIFILKWANSLLDIQIDEVLAFVADNDLQKISHEVLLEFATLKQKNYDTYLADAKTYGAEKLRREKEYNSLIFKMRKELMKR